MSLSIPGSGYCVTERVRVFPYAKPFQKTKEDLAQLQKDLLEAAQDPPQRVLKAKPLEVVPKGKELEALEEAIKDVEIPPLSFNDLMKAGVSASKIEEFVKNSKRPLFCSPVSKGLTEKYKQPTGDEQELQFQSGTDEHKTGKTITLTNK